MNPIPTQQYLFETFALDEENNLIWRKRPLHHFKNALAWESFNNSFEDLMASAKHNELGNVVYLNGVFFKLDRILHKLINGFDIQ